MLIIFSYTNYQEPVSVEGNFLSLKVPFGDVLILKGCEKCDSRIFFLCFHLSTTYTPKLQLRSYVAQVNILARCRLDLIMLAII
jgi:hypothetical protein